MGVLEFPLLIGALSVLMLGLALLTAVRGRDKKPRPQGAVDLRMAPCSGADACQDDAAMLRASEARMAVVPCNADALERKSCGPARRPGHASDVEEEVISALTNLGYRRTLAERAVQHAVQELERENFDNIFRVAAGTLSHRS